MREGVITFVITVFVFGFLISIQNIIMGLVKDDKILNICGLLGASICISIFIIIKEEK